MHFYIDLVAFLTVLHLIIPSEAYKILGLFPHHGRSHFAVYEPILRALAEKGHHVTVLSHYPMLKPIPRYKDISLRGSTIMFQEVIPVQEAPSKLDAWLRNPSVLLHIANDTCESGFRVRAVQELIKSKEQFDVVLAEAFNTDCFLGFAHKFGAPLVALSSSTLMPWTGDRFGQPDNPSYIPHNLLRFTDHMSFTERLENLCVLLFHKAFFRLLYEPSDQRIAQAHFGYKLPQLRDIAYNASLVLVNTHYSLNLPRPNVPAVVEVGGVHVGKVRKLSSNIERWINESAEGVVYFSLGSVIKGHTFPEEKRRAFLRAFARLPQRVLWKWENDTMPDKPANVMIQKWMPQLDILCHPNVKAFISHGGLLGTIEAVHCGVPAVVMPQFGDQFTNARALEANGGGLILHLHDATEDTVYRTLRKVLRTDFKKQAEELSERFRDRPMPPLETAIYWIEYVARHKGAHFMRTAAVGMPWYRYLLLDVVAFVLLVLAALLASLYLAIRSAVRLYCHLRTSTPTSTSTSTSTGTGKDKKLKRN